MNIFVDSYQKKNICIGDLCPSAKFILYVLNLKGPLTRNQLKDETLLPRRTIGFALKKLLEENIIQRISPQQLIEFNLKGSKNVKGKYDNRNQYYMLIG